MTDPVATYYPAELDRLAELRRAFAPGEGDPEADRLLEAIAFLTAGLRAHIDEAATTLADTLLERLLPHYLRPLPATTIVEFTPNLQGLRSRQRLTRGRLLRAPAIEGTRPRFRTTEDVDLFPIELLDAQLTDHAASPRLSLHLRATEAGARALADLPPLRLYLYHHDPALPAALLLWLMRYCTAITVTSAGGAQPLPPTNLSDPGFAPDRRLLPWPLTTPPGLAVLCEHHLAPDALFFVELRGIDSRAHAGRDLRIDLDFGPQPADSRLPARPPLPAAITRDVFRLHCAPAVNLFEVSAEPCLHRPLDPPHRLRADGVAPAHLEVFELLSVDRSDRLPLRPAAHAEPHEHAYQLHRRLAGDAAFDASLHLIHPADQALTADVTLSARMLCTNRQLPRLLGPGDLAEEERGPLLRSYKNLTPVTPPVRPDRRALAQWRRLAHRLAAASTLDSADALVAFLRLHDLSAEADAAASARHARRRAAIRRVDRQLAHRLLPAGGPPVPTLITQIILDQHELLALSDAYLLGAALDRLYASMTPLGCASQLCLVLHPADRELTWPIRQETA
ncbi:MAG: type VI secretion system baseplate subunit TssF [Nannocystis sp.]|nr:type VI secretion system baseplate subunit TssF [Nannocystis sp.]